MNGCGGAETRAMVAAMHVDAPRMTRHLRARDLGPWLLAAAGLALASLVALGCGPADRPGGDDDDGAGADGGPGFIDARPVEGADAGACNEVIDVVLVLDVSSSMGFVLDKLGTEIDGVVTAANQKAADAHFGLIVFADNHRLDDTGPLGGGKIHIAAASLKSAFQNAKTVYTNNNRNPGDGPGGPTTQNPICEENANDALYAAATDFPWRDNATRVVIVATDDTFLERPDNYGDRDGDGDTTSPGNPKEGDYPAARTMPETVAALVNNRVRVFSFTRLAPPAFPELVQCGTPRRFAWAAISDGWSTPYKSMPPLPIATDGANFDLAQVQSGALSLASTINQVVVDSYCNPPVP
jgi:hypothetical protein